MKQVTIYTDGACSGNPGPGGWGTVLLYQNNTKELSGSESSTTNNRMELLAAIKGLSALKEPCNVDLYTDSAYLYNAFEQRWIMHWTINGWLTASKKPVENKDLWIELLNLTKVHKVVFHKVKGHADNEMNNRCDKLATSAIKELSKDT